MTSPGKRAGVAQNAGILLGAVFLIGACFAADPPPPPGLKNIDWESPWSMTPEEKELVAALKEPLIAGMNVEGALQCWLNGRAAAEAHEKEKAAAQWKAGLGMLKDLKPLPETKWPPAPKGDLEVLRQVRYPDMEGVGCAIVTWTVDDLRQYGVLVTPDAAETGKQFPLLLYTHGAAFGVPLHALPWLAAIAREGYVIVGPAFRGEPLFATYQTLPKELDLTCEGQIENLDGEVNDALSALAGAQKLPSVKPGKFGVIGHSFGAGAGLLVTTRAKDVACMVSYDAWLTNPFRYYWDRMRRGANNWLSWASFCSQPVADQLMGLKKRSIVHNAKDIGCPLLLFIGGGYSGSVFHLSHEDLMREMRRYEKPFTYDVVPDGGHNFVLYYESEPARYAYKKHMEFLRKHLPPTPVQDEARAPAAGAQGDPKAIPAVPDQ